jgi:hypothetical protein
MGQRQIFDDAISGLPEAAQLRPCYDVDRLQEDLDQFGRRTWDPQGTVVDVGNLSVSADLNWTCLALRSPGGVSERTDPGGPGEEDFLNTPWIDGAPYMAQIMSAMPTELRSVRLMSLSPGSQVPEHRDTPTGFPYGFLRLHIPIRTNPDAALIIDGVEHHWQPGTLWYGDFNRPHSVVNLGDRHRVHLVLDCVVTPSLLELFPDSFLDRLPRSEISFSRPEVSLHSFERPDFYCTFALPPSFLRLDSPVGEYDEADVHAWVTEVDDSLVLRTSGGQTIGLVHVGGGEFRLQGWIEERWIHLDLFSGMPRVVLHTRRGRRRQQVSRPAHLSEFRP